MQKTEAYRLRGTLFGSPGGFLGKNVEYPPEKTVSAPAMKTGANGTGFARPQFIFWGLC